MKPTPLRRRRHRSAAIPCLAIFLGFVAVASAEENVVPVVVHPVERGEALETFELSGSVTARRESELSARTDGLILRLLVEEGDRVKEGDVLMELDAELADIALERSRQELLQAETRLREAQRLADEGSKLAKTGSLPTTEATAREAATRIAKAAVAGLQVDVRERQEIVNRHRLAAPFDGVISERLAEVGEWVSTGVPVARLVEVDHVWFDVRAPQERHGQIREGDAATVRIDNGTSTSLPAKVLACVPVKDPGSRTFLVRLTVEAPTGSLSPGVSGRARFTHREEANNSLTISRDAIIREPDGTTSVWVVKENGEFHEARRRVVNIGGQLGATVSVDEGLEEGDLVVVKGNESLTEGRRVRMEPAS
jgi:RND family efflux transporter MFP subunit